jgi:membrane protease subunit (stomatin/prohibitin family)
MNLVDIISWEVNEQELVHRFESDGLRLGSQLVVYPGQTAFFVKGGKICDEFASGTYTIDSENIPLLGKIVNIPFNGETPFKAEVWFVNNISLLDNKWGTMTPIQVEDPKYDVIVPVRAYGQYGMHVENARLFLEKLVGNMSSFETSRIVDYFKGVVLSKLTNIVFDALKKSNESVLTISSQVENLSEYAQTRLCEVFANYGIGLELFSIIAISVKEDDPSYISLKEAKDTKARINVIGKDDYQLSRSLDVLEKAADNHSGMAGAAMGIGAGIGLGSAAASLASGIINVQQSASTPPPMPSTGKKYYLAIDGKQQGPFDFETILQKYHGAEINAVTLVWTNGMAQWQKISDCEDFATLISPNCPPPIPNV